MFLFFGVVVFFANAVLNYYVLWWIVPNFLSSFVFHLFVYVGVPVFAIRSVLASFGLVGKEASLFGVFVDVKERFITKYPWENRKSD